MPPVFEPDFDTKRPLTGIWARFPHARRKIHLFYVSEEYLIFRPRRAPVDWWGGIYGINRKSEFIPKSSATDFPRNFLQKGHFFRIFLLPDPESSKNRLWRIHWHPEVGYISPNDDSTGLTGAFFQPQESFNSPKNLWQAPTEQLIEHFQKEWFNPASDVRLALPWCDWTDDERKKRALQWNKGSFEGLQSVLEASVKYESALWKERGGEERVCEEITLTFSKRGTFIPPPLYNGTSFSSKHDSKLFMIRFLRLRQRLQEINIGFYKLPIGTRREWWKSRFGIEPIPNHYRAVSIRLPQSSPSQHEILEATLFLHGWLLQNAPDLLPEWFPNPVSQN